MKTQLPGIHVLMVNHSRAALQTMDPEDVEDMSLDFTVTDTALGVNKTLNLLPGGAGIAVTGVRPPSINSGDVFDALFVTEVLH